jgi:hypothetical protein
MLSNLKAHIKKCSEWMSSWAEACDYSPHDYVHERIDHLQKQIDELKSQKINKEGM